MTWYPKRMDKNGLGPGVTIVFIHNGELAAGRVMKLPRCPNQVFVRTTTGQILELQGRWYLPGFWFHEQLLKDNDEPWKPGRLHDEEGNVYHPNGDPDKFAKKVKV